MVHHGAVRSYRTTIVAALVGVVLLAAVAGFAIALPKLVGEGESTADVAETLPDELLDGRLVSVDELDVPAVEEVQERRDFAAERFTEVFETDVAVEIYASDDLNAQAEVAVARGEAGFFKPGMPGNPETAGGQSWHELEAYGDVTCYTVWAPEQQTAANNGLPLTVYCQREADGLTFDIRTGGLTPDETAAALNEIVDAA